MQGFAVLLLIIVVVAAIICIPLINIWAINGLLGGAFVIPYTLKTWFCMFLLSGSLVGASKSGK